MIQTDYYICEQVLPLRDDFIDKELLPAEMRRVQEHLDLCADCAAGFRSETRRVQSVRDRMQRIEIPAGLCGRIVSALHGARSDGGPSSDDSDH